MFRILPAHEFDIGAVDSNSREKRMKKPVYYALILLTCLMFWVCGTTRETKEINLEEFGIVASSSADVTLVIWTIQQELEPAGKPLSEQQIDQIKEHYRKRNADESMKTVRGLLTSDQKKIMVDNMKSRFDKLGYPLSRKQIKLFMNYGPKSTVLWQDILTNDQNKAYFTHMTDGQK